MGEIAESIVDGELCQSCGVYIGMACGYPRTCNHCKRTENDPHPDTKVQCKTCGRYVKFIGMRDHIKAAHPQPESGK